METIPSPSEQIFFKTLLENPTSVLSPDPKEGPDGFPYLMVSSDKKNNDPFANVVKWCADRGIGIVVNPGQETQEYIFTYGMLWNFVFRGEFLSTVAVEKRTGDLNINHGQTVLVGTPSEEYWPTSVRKVFKEFLLQQGIFEIKVLLLFEKKDGPADFCFSIESLGNPPKTEWNGILEAFSWFFPRHYSLSLISEKNFDAEFTKI
jgi:hypothetical protein